MSRFRVWLRHFRLSPRVLGLLSLSTLLTGIALAATPLAGGEFEVTGNHERISVRAREAGVSDLIQAIGDRSGLRVIVMDGVAGLVSIELQQATPIAAIQAVAPRVVMVSGPDGGVSEVYVLPEGETGSLPASGSGNPSTTGEGTQPFQFTFDPADAPERTDTE